MTLNNDNSNKGFGDTVIGKIFIGICEAIACVVGIAVVAGAVLIGLFIDDVMDDDDDDDYYY